MMRTLKVSFFSQTVKQNYDTDIFHFSGQMSCSLHNLYEGYCNRTCRDYTEHAIKAVP